MTTEGATRPRPKRAPARTRPPARPRVSGSRLLGVNDEQLAELKLSREVAWYLVSRGHKLPERWQRPRWKTPEPGEVDKTAIFDPDRVDRVVVAFSHLRHTKGQWAGRALAPDVWQIAYILAPVFGWVAPNRDRRDESEPELLRVIRNLYVEVPRKNGKSTLLGGLGIYMACADGEQGAECVTGATTREQAGFVFDPVRQIAASSPALKPFVRALKSRVVHKPSGSYFQAISSVAEGQHGANLHFGCVDELHVHKTPDLVEAIETGTGSRLQPLICLITTADDGKPDTVYVIRRTRIVGLAQRLFVDSSTYGVIFAAAESEDELRQLGIDPFSEEAHRLANPGFGVSPSRAYLAGAATKAQQSPAELSGYLRLHLGIRTKQSVTYLSLDAWDRNMGLVDESRLKGRTAYGGLDLASTSDLTAYCLLFPADDGSFDALWRYWLPERAFDKLVKRTSKQAEQWRREGRLIVTDGDVVDDERVVADILKTNGQFKIAEVGYDPWNASAITNALTKQRMPLVEVRQGYPSLSPPLKEVHRLLLAGKPAHPMIRHGGHPVTRWCVGNLSVVMDENGNVKPDRKRSADKIDGVAALTIAMQRAMTRSAPRKSAYEDQGLEVV